MGLFRAKKKDVEICETEMSLPSYHIDMNGYVIFDDTWLGGADVIEVIPHVPTEGFTHEDPVFHDTSTDDEDYKPSTDHTWDDVRSTVMPAWVHFLNGLQQEYDGDSAIHLQVLVKKCRADEWNTRWDYACWNARNEFSGLFSNMRYGSPSVSERLRAAYASQYVQLMEEQREIIESQSQNSFDIRRLPAYKTRFFIVISYTPSSEGWWCDGRDTDYYVRDDTGAMSLFRDDKAVEKIANLLTRKQRKAQDAEVGGEVSDFFWIETDKIAQVLYTREQKILRVMSEWNASNPSKQMPFHLKKLADREVAALICFFPNILTPYWNMIWDLQANTNDVLYGQQVQRALDTGDVSILDADRTNALMRGIASDNVNVGHNANDRDAFLARYRGKDFSEIGTVTDEYKSMNWSPEKEEEQRRLQEEARRARSDAGKLWGDIDDTYAISEKFKTDEQRRQEFLARYKQAPAPLDETEKKRSRRKRN